MNNNNIFKTFKNDCPVDNNFMREVDADAMVVLLVDGYYAIGSCDRIFLGDDKNSANDYIDANRRYIEFVFPPNCIIDEIIKDPSSISHPRRSYGNGDVVLFRNSRFAVERIINGGSRYIIKALQSDGELISLPWFHIGTGNRKGQILFDFRNDQYMKKRKVVSLNYLIGLIQDGDIEEYIFKNTRYNIYNDNDINVALSNNVSNIQTITINHKGIITDIHRDIYPIIAFVFGYIPYMGVWLHELSDDQIWEFKNKFDILMVRDLNNDKVD